MFSSRDFDLFRCSEATGGPILISEDLMRCMVLYSIKEFPSVCNELAFLKKHYGKELASLIKRKQFVVCEYMDVVWAYTEIEDIWSKQQYFAEKAGFLKSLRDNMELVHLYSYYSELEPFELLDNAFDVAATLKDLSDASPIAWVKGSPVTAMHRKLQKDAVSVMSRLPNSFGCMGYNFTKQSGTVCMHDGCGLSLYKDAEFDFTRDGILLTQSNIPLFNYKKIEENFSNPMDRKGNIEALKETVASASNATPAEKKMEVEPKEMVYDLFLKTQTSALNPLTGDRKALKQVLSLFQI